jgi:hypothetical protein
MSATQPNRSRFRCLRTLVPALSLLVGLGAAGAATAAPALGDRSPQASDRAPDRGAAPAVAVRSPAAPRSAPPAPAPSPAETSRGSSSADDAPDSGVSGHRDADRDRRGRGTSRRDTGGGGGRNFVFSHWPWGYYHRPYWGGFYGYPYYYFGFGGYGGYGGPVVYPNNRYGRYGGLDLDIRPEKAQVFLDGQYIGVADQFDGFPNYLWLEQGTYDLVFYHPEFQTIARQYSIYSGLIIDVEDRMQRGEAVRPEDLPAKTTVRRDDRLRRDRDRRERAWALDRERPRGDEYDDEYGEAPEGEASAPEASGRLQLEVSPGDASIYLDGRFLGTGEDLARLHAGLIVDAGEHVLEVVRPGYSPERVELAIEPGEDAELDVELDQVED